MGHGVEKEALLKRKSSPAVVSGSELDDEEQPIGSLFKTKRPWQGKKVNAAGKDAAAEKPRILGDGDSREMEDTLASLRKKLKTPKSVKVVEEMHRSESARVKDSPILIEGSLLDETQDAVDCLNLRKRKPRASLNNGGKSGIFGVPRGTDRSSDEDLKDSLSAFVKKAQMGSACSAHKRNKKRSIGAQGFGDGLKNIDKEFPHFKLIERSPSQDVGSSLEGSMSRSTRLGSKANMKEESHAIEDAIEEMCDNVITVRHPSFPCREGLGTEEPLDRPCSTRSQSQEDFNDVTKHNSSFLSGTDPAKQGKSPGNGGSAVKIEENMKLIRQDVLVEPGGISSKDHLVPSLDLPSCSTSVLVHIEDISHSDGGSFQKHDGSLVDSSLAASVSVEEKLNRDSGKILDPVTGIFSEDSVSPEVRSSKLFGAGEAVKDVPESERGFIQSSKGILLAMATEAVNEGQFASAAGSMKEQTTNDDLINGTHGGTSLSDEHHDDFIKETCHEHVVVKEAGSVMPDAKELPMISTVVASDSNNEEKKQHSIPRVPRKVKKHRQGDMAYEGDFDWEVLMRDQGSFENIISADGAQSTRTSNRNGSKLHLPPDVNSGNTAAVAAGLKARAAGPIEKIKFKDILKRKGGLLEYLECRNLILGLWNNDVRNILTPEDCGVTAVPLDDEPPRASLIRDIFIFLDSSGYINSGIASDKRTQIQDRVFSEDRIPNGPNQTCGSHTDITSETLHSAIFETITPVTDGTVSEDAREGLNEESNNAEFPLPGNDIITGHSTLMSSRDHADADGSMKLDMRSSFGKEYDSGTTAFGVSSRVESEEQAVGCNDSNTINSFIEMNVKDESSLNIAQINQPLVLSDEHSKSEFHEDAVAGSNCINASHTDISVIDSNMCNLVINNTRSKVEDVRKKIIIVGAGPAGLTAARHLQRQGFCVIVLEARNRIGGRVFTDRSSLSVPVDLGASIITGVEADIATERRADPSSLICAQLGLELTVLNSDCPLYDIVTGKKVSADLDEALEAEFNSLLDDVVALNSRNGKSATELSLEEGLEYALKKHRMDQSTSTIIANSESKMVDETGALEYSEGASICGGSCTDSKVGNSNCSSSMQGDILNPIERRVMDWHFAHLEYGCAASLKDVSLLHWNQDDEYGGFGGAHCMIKGGYDTVLETLGNGINIHLNHVVTEVKYNLKESATDPQNSEVTVTTSSGSQFVGDALLITVPLGCLKASSIKFCPDLPEWKKSSIERLGFGVLNKVVLEFPEVFWDDTVDYFGATAEETGQRGLCFMFWNVKKTVGAPVLIALVAGKSAIVGQKWSTSDHVDHALRILRKLFSEKSVPDPVASVVTNWGMDPFTRGAYSYVAVGATGEDYDILGKPVANCLFFAGEATCKEHPDTVGGAMLSGLREAVRITDIFTSGNDYTAEVEAIEATQRQADNERNEVRDLIKRLESYKFSNILAKNSMDGARILPTKEALLQDMFSNAKTAAGRLHLAKELLHLPIDTLKSFAGTKEGLSILNSWILDSLGKNATQLLRHCVRLLVLVSTDLLAVRLSGVGKTVKDKVCVHTSRDIRAVASQLVNVWIEVFRKEKATRGARNLLKKSSASDSSKNKPKDQSLEKKPTPSTCADTSEKRETSPSNANYSKFENRTAKLESSMVVRSEVKSSCSQSIPGLDSKVADVEMFPEEATALAAAEAARAAALAAAEAYASSEAKCNRLRELPKIPSFHKFAKRDQYLEVEDFDFRRRKWSGGILGKQDCLSEIDSRNCRVRNWSVDFSAAHANLDGSRMSDDNCTQWSYLNDESHPQSVREHSGDSGAVDSRLRKAWVDTDRVGTGGVKDYTAIERWQSQAMDADAEYYHSMHLGDDGDSHKPLNKYQKLHGGSCASQATDSVSLSEGQPRGTELIKQGVVDYVASLLMPLYKTRKIDKEGYKSIMKKSTTKVMDQCTEAEKAMTISEFLDFRRKNKIRAFVDKLIERHMAVNQNVKLDAFKDQ